MRRKVVALVLGLCVLTGLFTGCGQSKAPEDSSDAGIMTSEENESGESDSKESGTMNAQTEDSNGEKELVSLRMVMYGDMTSRREEYFKNEFHDAVLEDLNIDLSVEFLPWGAQDNQVPTMLASGEAFATWNIVSALDYASKGYLTPIDEEMIREHCPNLLRIRGNNGFECVKHNGEIYAIPFGNQAYAGNMQFFDVRNDIIKQFGYEASEITTYDELMEVIAVVKEAYPDMRVVRDSSFMINALNSEISDQLINIISGVQFAYVDELEDGDKVYSLYESEAYKNLCRDYVGEWAQKGYIQMDEISNPTQGAADWEAGNCLLCYGTPGALISTSLKTVTPEAEESLIKIGDMPLLKQSDYGWGFSISASDAEHVDRWLDLFDWMYKDQDRFNFCVYGVEGKDWEYKEDGSIKKLVSDSFFDGWFMEAMDYNIYDSSISEETLERYKNNDNNSIMSKMAGFSFDSTPVASEVALLTAVWTEYMEPMTLGLLDFEENYDTAIKKLKEAGLDTYLEEYQRQYSEWYAANR